MLSVDVSSAGSVQVRSPYDGLISLSLSPLNIPHHHHHPTEFWECLVCCHLWTSRPSRSHVHTRTCVAGGISKNALAPHTHTHTPLYLSLRQPLPYPPPTSPSWKQHFCVVCRVVWRRAKILEMFGVVLRSEVSHVPSTAGSQRPNRDSGKEGLR